MDAGTGLEHRRELWREGGTMALYVAISLFAVLVALGEDRDHGQVRTLAIVWGTTIGLAIAHLFAFRVTARLVAHGEVDRRDIELSIAQLAGAGFVAAVVTVPVLLLPSTSELDVARLTLAGLIGGAGYLTARELGAGAMRSTVYAIGTVLVGAAVAVTKNVLSGH